MTHKIWGESERGEAPLLPNLPLSFKGEGD